MEFTVPQFIEKPSKIVGPLTFKQFIYIGTAGGICLFLYFAVPLRMFIIAATLLLGTAFALAFLKIGRTSLPEFLKNLFFFSVSQKIYLWKKKDKLPQIIRKEKREIKKEKVEEKTSLRITEHSRLRDLFTYLETKTK